MSILALFRGISALSGISPNIKIAMERAGNVSSKIDSEFTAVGINQTLHRIYLNLDCSIGILTPFKTVNKSVSSKVLLTETVIVGDVPSTYFDYDNTGFQDVLKNFQ